MVEVVHQSGGRNSQGSIWIKGCKPRQVERAEHDLQKMLSIVIPMRDSCADTAVNVSGYCSAGPDDRIMIRNPEVARNHQVGELKPI